MLRNDHRNRLAVQYFHRIVDTDAVPLRTLFQAIPDAPLDVAQFLRDKCRNLAEFSNFFIENSDVFFVENHLVAIHNPALVRGCEEAINHYREELNNYDVAPNFMNFRGHIGQAGEDAVEFINIFYPGREFKIFLQKHTEVFVVFDDETVLLIENECINYFEETLRNFGEMHFMDLRSHIDEAENHINDFIDLYYPEESFREFLLQNNNYFGIDNEDFVFLQ